MASLGNLKEHTSFNCNFFFNKGILKMIVGTAKFFKSFIRSLNSIVNSYSWTRILVALYTWVRKDSMITLAFWSLLSLLWILSKIISTFYFFFSYKLLDLFMQTLKFSWYIWSSLPRVIWLQLPLNLLFIINRPAKSVEKLLDKKIRIIKPFV